MTCVLGTDDASLAALLIASLAGDEKAYAAFLRQAARLVRAYVRRRTMQVA
jgi:RNA polymerase sigma-70 factor (ECF subfamily)